MNYEYDPAFRANEKLAAELMAMTAEAEAAVEPEPDFPSLAAEKAAPSAPLRDADAIVAHIEINNRHGVGVLIERLFGRHPNVLSVRSESHFGGHQDFGAFHLCIPQPGPARAAARETVRKALGPLTVGRILSVPFYPADVLNTLALKDLFPVPLATYLMDDQNVCQDGIPDNLMRELLERSSLRLAISPELAAAYEEKYGLRFWLMPPVAPHRHILDHPLPPEEYLAHPAAGAMLGNIWGQRWLDLLRDTVRDSGVRLRWHSTNHLRYLSGSVEELAAAGIDIPPGPPLADRELIAALRRTAFVVVPTGSLDEQDDRRFIAQLSLPSRIPFLVATAHTPLLVAGSERTGAARFVQELGLGLVVPYEREAFRQAVGELTRPEVNRRFRRRALALAARFSDAGAAEWIWQSLEKGEAFDMRFEDLMRKPRPDVVELVRAGRRP